LKEVLLSAKNINKSYGSNKVLSEVNFELFTGEILGLVGENGAGKSTLLKILSGVTPADSGSYHWRGEPIRFRDTLDASLKGVGMVFQEQNLIPTIPVFENMFLGRQKRRGILRDKNSMIKECEKMFSHLGIQVDPNETTGNLPIGSRQLLEISKAFMQTIPKNEYRVILLDEPTEALSKSQIELFYNIIRRNTQNTSFILVSHRLNETIALCDRLIAMKDGEVVTSMDVTAETTEDEIHKLMVGRQRNAAFYQEDMQRVPDEKEIQSIENVSIHDVIKNISLKVNQGEIIGLAGMLGSGRSELCRSMVGLSKPDEGKIIYLGEDIVKDRLPDLIKKGICYVPPERKVEGVILPHSIKWNLSLVTPAVIRKSPLLDLDKEKIITTELIEKMNIKAKDAATPAQELSGGNQQKVVLGKWLAKQDIKLIIVEEPTRRIDVGAKQEIYKLFRELAQNNISIIISTENLLELIGLCNKIIVMKDGRITACVHAPVDNKPHEVDIVKYMV
jgi:ribose transport system ATP-binding protein